MKTLTYEEWLNDIYWPLMGAEDDDDDTSTDDADTTSTDDADTSDADTSTDDTSDAGDDDTTTDANDADEDELDRIKSDNEKVRQELAAAQAAVRKAKAEARQAREDAAKKHGNWEQVAKERASEIEDLNERLQQAETKRIEATEELDTFRREVRITRIAARLGFRDPQDAIDKLKDKPESTGDDKTCERALRKLVEDKPYLIDAKRMRGRSMNGGNGPGMLTAEQMKNMTPDEINQHWEQVSKSMAGTGGSG